mmetsp:Transcript_41628/g.42248  ORF Transcript_41628/g.42248 Transcript_41628/m.42248 type:complete len:82 (+) Transcript_41628:155-400(+)
MNSSIVDILHIMLDARDNVRKKMQTTQSLNLSRNALEILCYLRKAITEQVAAEYNFINAIANSVHKLFFSCIVISSSTKEE